MDEIAIEKYLEATVTRRETWGREQSEKRYSFIKNEEHRRTGAVASVQEFWGAAEENSPCF